MTVNYTVAVIGFKLHYVSVGLGGTYIRYGAASDGIYVCAFVSRYIKTVVIFVNIKYRIAPAATVGCYYSVIDRVYPRL